MNQGQLWLLQNVQLVAVAQGWSVQDTIDHLRDLAAFLERVQVHPVNQGLDTRVWDSLSPRSGT